MKVYVFGNGNLSYENFKKYYEQKIFDLVTDYNPEFIVCDFRGTDILTLELLKTLSSKVSVYHIGTHPRYKPDIFRTKVEKWNFIGNFTSDEERDSKAISDCTHFLAFDFNSDNKRISGTFKNIEISKNLKKIRINDGINSKD